MAMAGAQEDRDALVHQLDALLPQLREIVDSLRPEAVLDTAVSQRGYRWTAGPGVAVLAPKGRSRARHMLRVPGDAGASEIEIGPDLLPAVGWLCAQRSPWSAEQAQAACPSIAVALMTALLAELVAQGLLETI
jgi:hypothetical protein